jgi:hypothetical protein
MSTYRIEVTGEFGGAVGGWRPAVTGALNQTGQSEEAASTFGTAAEAESVMHHVVTILHNDRSAEFRIVEIYDTGAVIAEVKP